MLKVAVIRFPGSNCDFDTLRAAERAGTDAYLVWHRDSHLGGADVISHWRSISGSSYSSLAPICNPCQI